MHAFPVTVVRVCLALGLVGATVSGAEGATHRSLVGREAPALVAPTVGGEIVDLSALRGHVVVLNLWASWCPPCRDELPMLARFQAAHRSDGLVLIALSADRHRDREDARRAIAGLGLTAAFMDGASANGYANPEVLPVTYVIGPDGIVQSEWLPGRGPLTEAQLAAAVAPLLTPEASSP